MLEEIFAYYAGKSAGRAQERRRRRERDPLTHANVVRARIIFAIVALCIAAAAVAAIVGTNPY